MPFAVEKPDPVLTPAQTYQKLLRGETEKVRFAEMAGRLANEFSNIGNTLSGAAAS